MKCRSSAIDWFLCNQMTRQTFMKNVAVAINETDYLNQITTSMFHERVQVDQPHTAEHSFKVNHINKLTHVSLTSHFIVGPSSHIHWCGKLFE